MVFTPRLVCRRQLGPDRGAALAAGPEAIVSHGSAAAVHGFDYGASGGVGS